MPARHTLRRQYIDGLGGGNGGSAVLRVPCPPPRPESGISSACPRVGSPGHRPTPRMGGDSLRRRLPIVPSPPPRLGSRPVSWKPGFPSVLKRDRVPGRRRQSRVPDLSCNESWFPGDVDAETGFPAFRRKSAYQRLRDRVPPASTQGALHRNPRVCGWRPLHANPRGAPRAYTPEPWCVSLR